MGLAGSPRSEGRTQAAGSKGPEDRTIGGREGGGRTPEPQGREGQNPRGRKKKGARSLAGDRSGPNSWGAKEEGARAPRGGGGQARRPVGASPGRGAEGSGVPCCAAPGISVPGPRGRLIPHPQVTSDHDLSPRCRDTASASASARVARHGSVAATPPCPRPVSALTAPALSTPAFSLQPRPLLPLLSAAME